MRTIDGWDRISRTVKKWSGSIQSNCPVEVPALSCVKDQHVQVRILGKFDTSLLPGALDKIETLPDYLDDSGRVTALRVLREQKNLPNRTHMLVVTSHDLNAPRFKRLFGLSDVVRQTAIVSTYHLHSDETARLRGRLENVIAHERGHLRGFHHCTTPGCLMYQARNVEDVDARSFAVCPLCSGPRANPFRGALLMILMCVIVFVCLDSVAFALQLRNRPFSSGLLNGKMAVFYKDQAIVVLQDSPHALAATRAQALARSLSAIFLQLNPAPFVVSSETPGVADIRVGDTPLLEFTTADAGGGDPGDFARDWLKNMEPILRGKGTASESCRDCHIRRLAETERWHRERGKGR